MKYFNFIGAATFRRKAAIKAGNCPKASNHWPRFSSCNLAMIFNLFRYSYPKQHIFMKGNLK
jgi:hypothetical protein